MPIYKHSISGPGAAGDVWTSGVHSFHTISNVGEAHAQWETAAAAIFGGAGVRTYWAPGTTANELATYQLEPTTGRATAVLRSSIAIAGISAGAQGPPRDCVVVGLRTVVPGARGRGRMYLPGVALSHLTADGLIVDAVRQAIADHFGSGLFAMEVASYIPGIWAAPHAAGPGGVPPEVFGAGDSIIGLTSVSVSAVPGTQRRRSNKIPAGYKVAALG
jgi:hypothetical protein